MARGHGEGSIYWDGARWRATVDLGREGGTRKRKYLSGKTKREVQQKLLAAQQAKAQGLPAVSERQTSGSSSTAGWPTWSRRTSGRGPTPATASSAAGIAAGLATNRLSRTRL